MKNFLKFVTLMLSLVFTACGSKEDFRENTYEYQVSQDLAATGTVTLSFEQVSLYKTINVSAAHAGKCKKLAEDYTQTSGIGVSEESLTIDNGQPKKHCARRNVANQCETSQYVATFNCHFKTK